MQLVFALSVLTGIHGVFVMAEYALGRTSASRRGSNIGRVHYSPRLRRAHEQLEEYLMVCQICRTMGLLGMGVVLGFLTSATFGNAIEPTWSMQGQFALWFVTLGVAQLVVGYELPKQVGINRSEQCAENLLMHLWISHWLVWPLIWVIRRLSAMTVRHWD